ncbi:hypothetical protein H5410_016210 [Solanum commersonii]|uniref:Uncharacterized protein n=1 Tax=Solanum commersonii TaxID=4109 RepID=A0A9J5ZWQ3_SOLCO|nr:hypothetical protein H5410_016210 [Solanum commersonii]
MDKQEIMLRIISDHAPLQLLCREWEKPYFEFEDRYTKELNKTSFGNLEHRKNELLGKMAHFDRDYEDKTLQEEEWVDRACLHIELKDIAKYEGLAWRQHHGYYR